MPNENVTCGLEIARCRATIDQLRRELARTSAEAAAKSALLAELGHELRTPLSAIIGFAELMQSGSFGPVGNQTYCRYIEDIIFCGRHLLGIVNATLDITRHGVDAAELNEEPVAVAEVVDETFRLISPMAEQGGVAMLWRPGPGALPALYCDRLRLRQILLNLVSNAVKFTGSGGTVEISADLTDGLALVVSDTGIGIEQIPAALSGLAHEGPGEPPHPAGLGVMLAKALIEQHGGSLSLRSTPRVGTVVRISFPTERIRPGNPAAGVKAIPHVI
jgi:signal transduction histidine kinase